jgi:hypothetical protein
MKHIGCVIVILLWAQNIVGTEILAHCPGAKKTLRSPDHRYTLVSDDSNREKNPSAELPHDLYLRTECNHQFRKIHSYDRNVSALWSPDSRFLVINDTEGSNHQTCYVYDLSIHELVDLTKSMNLADKDYLHIYFEGIEWEDKSSLLIKVRGDTEEGAFDRWFLCNVEQRHSDPLSARTLRVHGRLSYYNGTPFCRIWIVGTKRVLGIVQSENEVPSIPRELRELMTWDRQIFADFVVEPITTRKVGVMQMVRVLFASNVVVKAEGKVVKKLPSVPTDR